MGEKDYTCQEAGRLGGLKLKERMDPDGFRALGRKGGETTSARHGPAHYQKIGALGGAATRDKHPGLFREMGKRGAARRAELIARGRKAEEEE